MLKGSGGWGWGEGDCATLRACACRAQLRGWNREEPVARLERQSKGKQRVRQLVGGAWARQGRGLSSRAAPPLPLGLREAATASPCLFSVVGDLSSW